MFIDEVKVPRSRLDSLMDISEKNCTVNGYRRKKAWLCGHWTPYNGPTYLLQHAFLIKTHLTQQGQREDAFRCYTLNPKLSSFPSHNLERFSIPLEARFPCARALK